MIKPLTKYKGSLKMAAIGDSLGWMTEFADSKKNIQTRFGIDYIDKYYSWSKRNGGRFYGYTDNIEQGSYSDDTQMTLCVARSIRKGGIVDNTYFSKVELRDWLMYQRGAGHTVKVAARNLLKRSVEWNRNFYKDKKTDYRQAGANGAAMRILPIALVNVGNEEQCLSQIFQNSIITHGHPRAILGAMLFGYVIEQIVKLQPDSFNSESFLIKLGNDVKTVFKLDLFKEENGLKKWILEWDSDSTISFEAAFTATIGEIVESLRIVYVGIKDNYSVDDVLRKLGCYVPETKGSGIGTVCAGIYLALKFSNNPLDVILNAVNAVGTDTDSIAAFAGAMIGALHGQSVIPPKWNNVQNAKYIDSMAERLLSILYDSEVDNTNNNQETLLTEDYFNIDDNFFFKSLGKGYIKSIDRQPTLTKGKYSLLMDIQCDNGQTVRVVKLFSYNEDSIKELNVNKTHYKYKELESISSIIGSHGVGLKKVLCSKGEAASNITQIAVSTLKVGDIVAAHVHLDMEEFFIIESGVLEFILNGEAVTAKTGSYIQVPIGMKHSLNAISDVKMITIGCKK